MKPEETLAALKPFLEVETEGDVATIRVTVDVLDVGLDVNSMAALRYCLEHVARLPQKAVLFITTRRCFSAGRCDALWRHMADLNGEYLNDVYFRDKMATVAVRREENMFHWLFHWLRSVPKPVIIAFRGEVALPFFGVGLACEHRIAASDTVFCNRCPELDIPPAIGLLYMLPAYVGVGRAASLLMRSGEMTAREAFEWGLIDHIVPDDQLEYCAKRAAEEMAKRSSPNSIAAMKNLLSQHLPPPDLFFTVETRGIERTVEKHESAKHGGRTIADSQSCK